MTTHSHILAQIIPIHGVTKELDVTGQLSNNKSKMAIAMGCRWYWEKMETDTPS